MNMVGFLQGPATKVVKAEVEEDVIKNHSFSDPKKTNGLCTPGLDDFSLSFSDSFLDFESGWCMEGSGVNMADLGGSPVDFYSLADEFGSIKKEFEVFGDEICQKDETVEDLGGKVESDLEQKNGEIGVVERSVEKGSEIMSVEGVVAGDGSERKLGDLGVLIEEQLGKVSLDGAAIISSVNCEGSGGELGVVESSKSEKMAAGVCDSLKSDAVESVGSGDSVGVTGNEIKGDGDESGSDEEESEDESSSDSSASSSSSALSSSSSDDEDSEESSDEKEDKKKDKEGSASEQTEIEDGEIMLSDAEMVAWSDNEDDDGGGCGPIKSKNELKDLPPVPSVCVTLEPHHQTLPVGAVLSIMPPQVIVEGVENHNPLNEGSILWITDSRTPLGIVDEIFGPVKNPYYVVRYNSENEVPTGIEQGTLISFVAEFADHVLNDKSIYKKGYDASNENDEELSEEAEFSDDEKEAEFRRMQKVKKRGTSESKPGNKRKDKRQSKNQRGDWNNNRDPAAQTTQGGDRLPAITEGQQFVPPVGTSLNQENRPCPSGPRQGFAGDQAMIPPFPQRPQAPGFPAPNGAPGFSAPNVSWNNGFPQHQQQNVNLLSGLPPNGMLWMQQTLPYLYQTPLQNGAAFQQQMGMIPGLRPNFNPMTGQPNFGGTLPPWNMDQNAVNPSQFGMNQNALNPMQFGMNQNAANPQFGMNQNAVNPQFGMNQNAVNPSQFGMNQNAVNPSQFGMNQNAGNPSQFGMNQNAGNPSQFGMNQNAGNSSQFGMNQNAVNPSQGALPPNGSGEQAVQSQGSQDSRNVQQPPPAFSFNGGRGGRGGGGGGRRGNHRGRGHFGGGRGRRS